MIELDIRWKPRDFDLQVAFESRARQVALFGPSGSGKTSVLLAIAGLRRPDAGRIRLAGELLFDSARGVHVAPARRGLGVVFQDGRLFPHLRVNDNLLYGQRSKPNATSAIGFDTAVGLLGLTDLLDRWPAPCAAVRRTAGRPASRGARTGTAIPAPPARRDRPAHAAGQPPARRSTRIGAGSRAARRRARRAADADR